MLRCKKCGQPLPYPKCRALLTTVWPKWCKTMCGKRARFTVNGVPRCGHHSKPGERKPIGAALPDTTPAAKATEGE